MANKLYYGGGNCSIESGGSNIRGVEIHYKGAIEIEDKTSNSFIITHQGDGILIFPIGKGTLNDLFDYVGEFRIVSVIAVDDNTQKVSITIHKSMDYTELLTTKSEDMTTKSEDLSATHVSGKKVSKTSLNQPHLNNQHTSDLDTSLHLEDGTLYSGTFHVHLIDNSVMTGKTHTEDSQDLYFKNGKPTKNPELIPYAIIEQNKRIKVQKLKSDYLKKQRHKRKM